jgi:hypothetical protein
VKLQVGDRVRVYHGHLPRKGVVKAIDGDGVVVVVDDKSNFADGWFHYKQCRRLKPKKKRRVWVASWVFENNVGAEEFVRTCRPIFSERRDYKDWVECIEVRKPK